jgi:hypothetical protein
VHAEHLPGERVALDRIDNHGFGLRLNAMLEDALAIVLGQRK